VPLCPGDTQVGVANIELNRGGITGRPAIYNLTPTPGSPVTLGLSIDNNNGLLNASVRTGADYGATVTDASLPVAHELQQITTHVWGVPMDKAHDHARYCIPEGEVVTIPSENCASSAPQAAFLSLPTRCGVPLLSRLVVHSTEGDQDEASVTLPALKGCEAVPFEPQVTAGVETAAADSPTGLAVGITIPQSRDPKQRATAHLKDTVVTLPAGLAVNPSAAIGRAACSLAQIDLAGPGAASCPAGSQVGTVFVESPLLDHPLEGSVFLARQGENPFGSLIALYIAVDDPVTGIVVKQAIRVSPDPVTGRLTAFTEDTPQLPFEHLDFSFFGGPRAALTTPATCGIYTTGVSFTPWTAPEGLSVGRTDGFAVTQAAGGGPCAASETLLPNTPVFTAGTVNPLAGSYSPFVMHLARQNGSQRLSAIDVTLPPGVTGKIAGVAQCSDAQLAAASARSNPGQGALEQASPSCPATSRLGTVSVGAGSGSPLFAGGVAYLAGPYEGAPFSLAIITPAVAGPFDLGVVLVRAGLFINPTTAQVTVRSDQIPTILQGIPLDVRSIDVNIDRPEFTLNPTNCEPMSITAQAISTLEQTALLSQRFQASGCRGLPFKPSFTASTQGKTSKANGASLTVNVSQRPGEANIHRVALTLPTALPARLTTLQKACTEAQFAANPAGCPPGSFIGTAKAITPILSVPLTGPAILVSHGGAAFPDVVFLLQANEHGGTIRIELDGKTDIKKGITYSRFETVPDAPISSFETSLPQGPHSVLAAPGNLCTSKLAMPTQLTGQNGALINQTTKITVTGCPKTKTLTRAQKLTLALKACHKQAKGAKRKACEHRARKLYGPLKKK
jgi:hypothetical protein